MQLFNHVYSVTLVFLLGRVDSSATWAIKYTSLEIFLGSNPPIHLVLVSISPGVGSKPV